MKKGITSFRTVAFVGAFIGTITLAGVTTFAIAQDSTDQAADAAEQVAQDAQDAIRVIDPTTGGGSLEFDPSLPQSFDAHDNPVILTPENDDISMPTLDGTTADAAPRGPATRLISNPQVQTVPAAAPARVAQSSDPFVVKSILPIEGTIRYGEWFWDESDAPAKGENGCHRRSGCQGCKRVSRRSRNRHSRCPSRYD